MQKTSVLIVSEMPRDGGQVGVEILIAARYAGEMNWACHSCGERHQGLPKACRSCGTKPEIVVNLWRCGSCQNEGIPATETRCPSCGAEPDKDAAFAVGEGLRIEGDLARDLATGTWRYCAFCRKQVAPVVWTGPKKGEPQDRCPTCSGELQEATEHIARRHVSGAQASTYQKNVVTGSPADALLQPNLSPLAEPTAPAFQHGGWVIGTVGVLLLVLLGAGYAAFGPRSPEPVTVSGRSWVRVIDLEFLTKKATADWQSDVPAKAYNKHCTRKFKKNENYVIGQEHYQEVETDYGSCLRYTTRTVEEKIETGQTCAEYGYESNGGVSVKTCSSWETTYKTLRHEETTCAEYGRQTVEKTRDITEKRPLFEDYCQYEIDTGWKKVREIRAAGALEDPKWPAVPSLGERERAGEKHEHYLLQLRDQGGKVREWTTSDVDAFLRHPVGSTCQARLRFSQVIEVL